MSRRRALTTGSSAYAANGTARQKHLVRMVLVALMVTMIGFMSMLRAQSAQALIVVAFFQTTPSTFELGGTVTLNVAWPSGVPGVPAVPGGCDGPVDYVVYGPSPNPDEGDWGPEVASGTLDMPVYENNMMVSYGQAQYTPTTAGTYTIAPGPSAPCGSPGIQRGEFVVTPSTAAPDHLALSPDSQSHHVDETASVTATLTDGATGQPRSGTKLTFAITGDNSGITGTCLPSDCVTNSSGQVQWSYAGLNTGHDTINAQFEGQTSDGAAAQAGADWTPSLNGAAYAALGDSFSAGEGTGNYQSGTNVPTYNMCHRSSSFAYGVRLRARFPLGSFAFAACSGAITDDLFNLNNEGNGSPLEPAQLCRTAAFGTGNDKVAACGGTRAPVVGSNTKLITLTIGGNDAGFSWVVQHCFFVAAGIPGRNCWRNPNVVLPTDQRLLALAGLTTARTPNGTRIHSILATLRAIHTAAPNAHVYIAGYPRLFQSSGNRDCVIGSVRLPNGSYVAPQVAPADAAWMDSSTLTLNTIIATAATAAGRWATYVNATNRFNNHGACSSDPWLNPVTGTATLVPFSSNLDPGGLHPTVTGQANGYEQAFLAAGFPN